MMVIGLEVANVAPHKLGSAKSMHGVSERDGVLDILVREDEASTTKARFLYPEVKPFMVPH